MALVSSYKPLTKCLEAGLRRLDQQRKFDYRRLVRERFECREGVSNVAATEACFTPRFSFPMVSFVRNLNERKEFKKAIS